MKDILVSAGKRFLRVGLASGAGYGTCYALNDLTMQPETMVLAVIVPGIIAAIGKFIRARFGIKLPF